MAPNVRQHPRTSQDPLLRDAAWETTRHNHQTLPFWLQSRAQTNYNTERAKSSSWLVPRDISWTSPQRALETVSLRCWLIRSIADGNCFRVTQAPHDLQQQCEKNNNGLPVPPDFFREPLGFQQHKRDGGRKVG